MADLEEVVPTQVQQEIPLDEEPKEEQVVDELKNLTEEEKEEVKEVFEMFDKENNQTIEKA